MILGKLANLISNYYETFLCLVAKNHLIKDANGKDVGFWGRDGFFIFFDNYDPMQKQGFLKGTAGESNFVQ